MEKIKNFFASLKDDAALRNKVIIGAAAALVLIVLIIVLCVSCGNNGGDTTPSTDGATNDPGMVTYSVTVTDALGNPCSGVIVNFLQDGQTVAMQTVNDQGAAEKSLAAGEYTVQLGFVDADAAYHYETENTLLTAENASLEIVLSLALGDEVRSLSASSVTTGMNKDYDAYYISAGCTYVDFVQQNMDTADRNYFIFIPEEDGVYEFAVIGSDMEIGYYGGTFFVQSSSLAETAEDGSFTVDIAPSMISTGGSTTALVIGVDANGGSECIISIQRIGDHVPTIEDYPWQIYEATAEISPFTLPEGTKLVDFDVTAASGAYTLVYNETDGYYHLNSADGPVVYLKLGTSSAYLDSFETILESSPIVKYYFDENGEFEYKVSFTECMNEYVASMDEAAGVYPLTEDLKYIIQERGEYVGWWDSSSGSFIFKDSNGNPIPGLNTDIAWLFACCYEEAGNGSSVGGGTQQVGTAANDDAHVVLGGEEALTFSAAVNPGEYVWYDLYKVSGSTLTITADHVYVIYDGETYWPNNGVLSIPVSSDGPSVPITVGIGNCGTSAANFTVKMVYPVGSYSNPASLSLGSITTNVEEGNDQGYYYTYTATASGTLTITFESINIDKACGITLYNLTTYEYQTVENGSVSVSVSNGDTVQIIISVIDPSYEYPAATIKVTAAIS